jgi:hypothetical protein
MASSTTVEERFHARVSSAWSFLSTAIFDRYACQAGNTRSKKRQPRPTTSIIGRTSSAIFARCESRSPRFHSHLCAMVLRARVGRDVGIAAVAARGASHSEPHRTRIVRPRRTALANRKSGGRHALAWRISLASAEASLMHDQAVSPELAELGNGIVDRMAHALGAGAREVHLQLLASYLFEAVKADLARTAPDQAERRALLAAVADQCRRSAAGAAPSCLLVGVRAAVDMLERGRPAPPAAPPPRRRPELRVIRGGLA